MEEFANQHDHIYEDDEEQQPYSVWSVIKKYGLFLGIAIVVFNLMTFLTGMYLHWVASLVYVLYIAAIVFAHQEYKRKNEGFMSYGQGVGIGTALTVIGAGVIGSAFFIFYTTSVEPEIGQKIQEYTEEVSRQLLERWGASEEQIEDSEKNSKQWNTPLIKWIANLFGVALYGVIFSLIISIFTKKKRPLFEY